mmetsp:Transcript_30104/g.69458  ORF Transcript_30104/g.69458 Transcript_30104/m.69458 type:complete len:98 (+) Transcript_30104:2837-3130(+)
MSTFGFHHVDDLRHAFTTDLMWFLRVLLCVIGHDERETLCTHYTTTTNTPAQSTAAISSFFEVDATACHCTTQGPIPSKTLLVFDRGSVAWCTNGNR